MRRRFSVHHRANLPPAPPHRGAGGMPPRLPLLVLPLDGSAVLGAVLLVPLPILPMPPRPARRRARPE